MTFNYWTSFSKKENSTAQPSGSGTAVTGVLKMPTNVMKPTIILDGHVSVTHNYWQIPDFNRYYKVSEMRYVGPNTEIDLEVDVLATYKTNIGSYSGLIARTNDVFFADNMIPDPACKDTGDFDEYVSDGDITKFGTAIKIFDQNYGVYVITVVGKPETSGTSRSFATHYALTQSEMADLAEEFNDPTFLQNIKQEFTNPMDSVCSCIWIPISLSNINTNSEIIHFGSYATTITGHRIIGKTIEGHNNIALNSGAYSINKTFRNTPPYSTYSLYLPFVGTVELDYQAIWENWQLNLWTYVDVTTGDVVYKILNEDDTSVFATYSGNCASDVPISNQKPSATKSLSAVGLLVGGSAAAIFTAATGGAGAAVLGTFAAGAASSMTAAISGLQVHTQTSGSISSSLGAKVGIKAVISIYKKKITAQNQTELGLPVYQIGTPSSHSGFCQFVAASISVPGFAEECDRINTYLNGGFFYE